MRIERDVELGVISIEMVVDRCGRNESAEGVVYRVKSNDPRTDHVGRHSLQDRRKTDRVLRA